MASTTTILRTIVRFPAFVAPRIQLPDANKLDCRFGVCPRRCFRSRGLSLFLRSENPGQKQALVAPAFAFA